MVCRFHQRPHQVRQGDRRQINGEDWRFLYAFRHGRRLDNRRPASAHRICRKIRPVPQDVQGNPQRGRNHYQQHSIRQQEQKQAIRGESKTCRPRQIWRDSQRQQRYACFGSLAANEAGTGVRPETCRPSKGQRVRNSTGSHRCNERWSRERAGTEPAQLRPPRGTEQPSPPRYAGRGGRSASSGIRGREPHHVQEKE